MPTKLIVKIGTRQSKLALAQSRQILKKLIARYPKIKFRLVKIKTFGDEFQGVEIFKKTNQGVFTKTIESKLLSGQIDIAIHSMKDLPTQLPSGLTLAAFPKRVDASDVLITKKRLNLKDLPKGSLVGTGSPRRKRQIQIHYPDLVVKDLRGNLDTRIKKVINQSSLDAVVVARAGLLRIGGYEKYCQSISQKVLLPAVGQGSLAIEIRANDKKIASVVKFLNHLQTERIIRAERKFLESIHGGCRVPVGICSEIKKGKLFLYAAVFSTKRPQMITGHVSGSDKKFESLGVELAKKLLQKGAKRFLDEARSAAS